MYLFFHLSACFEHTVLIIRRVKLCQYIIWYVSLYEGDFLVCHSFLTGIPGSHLPFVSQHDKELDSIFGVFHRPVIKVQKLFVLFLRQEFKKAPRQLYPLYPRVVSLATQYVRTTIPLTYKPKIHFLLPQGNK
jgi:hypothetical protein